MAKKKFKKKCKNCGKNFDAMNVRKTHCSDTCKSAFHRKNNKKTLRKKCIECKKKFTTPSDKTRFCSPKCVGVHKNRDGTGKEMKCRQCKKNFNQKHKRHFFCSDYCKGKWGMKNSEKRVIVCSHCKNQFERSVYQKTKGAKNEFCSKRCESGFRENEASDERICEHCEKPYKCKKGSPKRFCSIKCQGKWQSECRVGVNSSNYDKTFSEKDRVVQCQKCKKKIRISKSEINSRKYCSKRCKIISQGATMTSPHRKTIEILRNNRIWNRSENKAGRYLLDCYLGKGLAIEVQGKYWHGDIRIYPTPIDPIQKRADKRDRRKKDFLNEKGITVLYIWEDDIENDPKMCEKLILKFKERNGILSNYHSMNYHTRGRSVALNKDILVPRFER